MADLSTPIESSLRSCPSCGHELALGAVACPACHTLVHGDELNSLAAQAKSLEAQRRFSEAHNLWSHALTLLPPDSKQAEWVREHLIAVQQAAVPAADPGAHKSPEWARRLGPLGPIAIVLAKSKGLLLAIFKLKFLLSFASFLAIYAGLFGWRYGVGFGVCILIHEMGHFVDIRRRGLPAEMPVFLPGLGAYVRWNALGVTRRQIAQISLAGPLAGWIAAACCFLLYAQTHDMLWAALARTGAVINLLNLIPVPILDGGNAIKALGLVERTALLAVALALWLFTGSGIFFLLAAGIAWRLFTKDKPQQDDWSSWLYFAAVMVVLAVVLHAAPDVPASRTIR